MPNANKVPKTVERTTVKTATKSVLRMALRKLRYAKISVYHCSVKPPKLAGSLELLMDCKAIRKTGRYRVIKTRIKNRTFKMGKRILVTFLTPGLLKKRYKPVKLASL